MAAQRSVPFNAVILAATIFFSVRLSAETIVLRDFPACPADIPDASWNDCKGDANGAPRSNTFWEPMSRKAGSWGIV